MRQHYTEEEANGILQRAVECQVGSGGMSREQFESVALEIGVTSEALDRAEAEWDVERANHSLRDAFEAEKRALFRSHLISYLGVNIFLLILNGVVTPGFWWAVFPILGWGLGLFFHAMAAYGLIGNENEAEFLRWRARHPDALADHESPSTAGRLLR